MPVRVLFLADTHLGFDLPIRPRVRRRRRGHDFLANYERALAPALAGEVDLVVHGGDVFHEARVPHTLVYQAFEPLRRLGDSGVAVFVVPGNHERSRIPHARFARHPAIHVFDAPRAVTVRRRGLRIAVAGFPFQRGDVRSRFPALLGAARLEALRADVTVLCTHQCFEGATVGPSDYTFRSAPDVIRGRDVPDGVAAVLTGHVHRHQVLSTDLVGRPLAAPVLYPGSTERTAFAEMGEAKGYLVLELDGAAERRGGRLERWTFEALPARPMVLVELEAGGLDATTLERRLCAAVERVPADAVLRIRLHGRVRSGARSVLAADRIREWAPHGMNVEVVLADEARRAGAAGSSGPAEQLRASLGRGA